MAAKKFTRGVAWCDEEDDFLAKAWRRVSEDPIKGNNRKSDQFWNDVFEVFQEIDVGQK
jgi:hypothetical protein